MLGLVLFEIRKNYLRKYVITFFFLLVLLNIVVVYQRYVAGDKEDNYFMPHDSYSKNQWYFYQRMHEKLDGKLTNGKINFVSEEFKRLNKIINQGTFSTKYQSDTYTGYIFGDYQIIKDYFYKPMKYITEYESNMDKVLEKAKDNVEFYKLHLNRFDMEKNQYILAKYAGRKIDAFYDTKPWEKLFNYKFSDLLIACLMILGIVPIFVYERETKMSELILSSGKGKLNMTIAKVLSSFVFIAFLVFIFSALNILEFKILYGLNGSGMPIYTVEMLENTPLNCSISLFYCLITLLKIVGFFSYGMMICFCSSLFRRVKYPYMLSVLLLVIGLYTSGYLASIENARVWTSLTSPFTLIKGEQLYLELLGLNLADRFFLRVNLCILIQIAAIMLFFLLIRFFGTKIELNIKIRRLSKEGN